MIHTFINKIINDWEKHFKKPGNQTLGSLPTDWELELKEMLEEAFNASRDTYKNENISQSRIFEEDFIYKYQDFYNYLESKENDK